MKVEVSTGAINGTRQEDKSSNTMVSFSTKNIHLDQCKTAIQWYSQNLCRPLLSSQTLIIKWQSHSWFSSLYTRGLEDTYEGNINDHIFCDFIEWCLMPILQPLMVQTQDLWW